MGIVNLGRVAALVAAALGACGDDDMTPPDPPDAPGNVPGSIQLDQASYSVDEDAGTLTVNVVRAGGSSGSIQASVTVTDATAMAGSDFTAPVLTMSWDAGDATARPLVFQIADDGDAEGDETFTLDLALGAGSAGQLGSPSSATVTIADDDMTPTGPGDTYAVTSTGRLVSFFRAEPSTLRSDVALTGIPSGETVLGGDIRPANGKLYLLTSAAKLYAVDLATGAATPASTLAADPADASAPFTALAGAKFGVDFNPVPDRLRIVSDVGQNLRVNVDTGATITDGTLNGAATTAGAAAYTNSFSNACRTSLFVIDTASDKLYLQNPPNDGVLAAIGALGVDAQVVGGFEVATDASGGNMAIAALTVGGATALYRIDLASGAAAATGPIGTTDPLVVLASPPPQTQPGQTAGELYGVTTANRLVTFNRAAPAKLCTSEPISGLASGETVLGIDFRPSTGDLYALGRTGRLYVVDRMTGRVKSGAMLSEALDGTEFGMDFNPTGVVGLRIVSDKGQNLRVTDPATGATTKDSALNPGSPMVAAAAYTNSVPLAGTTTLYVIDVQTDRLAIQNPPNNGTLADVGALGVDIGAVNGFDIDGRNGVALLAATVAGATVSTLYTVDLATGAVSAPLGTIGGGAALRGLALPTPTATLFGATAGNQLVKLAVGTGAVTSTPVGPISGLAAGETVLGLDVRPSDGRLHALTATRVYTVDPATGAATQLSMLAADPSDATEPFAGLSGTSFGVDFNPTGPVALRIVSDAEQNLRVPNVATGATFTDTKLSRAPFPVAVTAAAYSNSFASPPSTTLYVIDTMGDRLLAQNPPNAGALRVIGPLGVDADQVNGFDILSADTAVAILGNGTLYSIDLATGAATAIGAVGSFQDLRSLAGPPTVAAPAADSTLYAVAGTTLLSFPRNAPQNATSIGAIDGLQPGETVLGIDFRPANSLLHLVGSTGRIYTLDLQYAVATQVGQIQGTLTGTAFGVDFNPMADRLRVVSNTGENLRIVIGGDTTGDGTLGMPAPDVVAAAYTRSFAGSTATQLFVIDIATGSLLRQDPPNDGVLFPVGALSASLNFGAVDGFDIAGGHDGLALAVLQPAGGTQSVLYRVNLATGVATAVGPIGDPAGPLIGALAIRLQ